MTEEEAKTKWCPYARVESWSSEGTATGANFNRTIIDSNPPEARCIGSTCMAWRKHKYGQIEGERIDGYCGLAGKP
jgi:hypothetical protein